MIELETKARPPVRRPGPACRWCPLQEDCDDGQTWIRTADDDLDLG
jgi:hypothetical protein